ncbi:MAG: heme-copper oxidase subunit III [Leptolyngbya sp. Prado105]|jgi:cytochrome c oxidase subunit 3|nr:heme-copper oxidase subunit III [Leptolyngbya sp. Prado105]
MTTERVVAQDAEARVRSHQEHNEAENSKFGLIAFLLSESVIFIAFFVGYILFKTQSAEWYPPGVTGLAVAAPRINTIVLVSSSFVIYVAERYLHDKKLWGFRLFLLATMLMGGYFLFGQAVEWSELPFGFREGVFGGSFYLLTGFHGLHVLTGLLLQTIMLGRSFIPNNYENGFFGVEATSLFWHFVDVIWIVLFILIYVWQ